MPVTEPEYVAPSPRSKFKRKPTLFVFCCIPFAVFLGIGAALIRRLISKFRKKYFDKTVKQTKWKILYKFQSL